MPDLVNVAYAQTGKSLAVNRFGMREMQERVYAQRKAQYLLIKAPPASGKSRALMFLGLDKLYEQGLKKVIVAVPERSIGSSFAETDLTAHGFFADWTFNPDYNLCTPGGETSKVKAFGKFLNDPKETILICTHATLRFGFDSMETSAFNRILLAIDEFHHVSADEDSKLGEVLRAVMDNSDAHIVAMTGSYFRGDGVPVIMPEVEARFTKVTYNYYEQLNGYTYLKTLGIGYHFYQGRYTSAIQEVLDTNKKTILHIPNVNAGESTKDKYREVDTILDIIGDVAHQDPDTGVIHVKRKLGTAIKTGEIKDVGGRQFVRMAGKFVNIEDLHIDLIDSVNPFQKAFEVLSKSVTAKLLKVIQDTIEADRIQMTDEESVILYRDKIPPFMKRHGRELRLYFTDPLEHRMAEAIVYLRNKKRQMQQEHSDD